MSNEEFASRPFEKLKKKIAMAEAAAVPASVPKKKKKDYSDEELFSAEMNGVREIEAFRSLVCGHRTRTYAAWYQRDEERDAMTCLEAIAKGEYPLDLAQTQEYVAWAHGDYRPDIVASLHQGRFAVQDCIDLHGCTVPQAEEELDEFLHTAFRKSLRCVKVIHGRGLRSTKGARLKEAVVKRLSGRYRKELIAYVTAPQHDGGLGAVYVLLLAQKHRRNR
jgi:DNA-nicking Smr family endonuclease